MSNANVSSNGISTLFTRLSLRYQLAALLGLCGLVAAMAVFGIFQFERANELAEIDPALLDVVGTQMLLGTIIVAVLIAGLGFIVGSYFARPIGTIAEAIERLSQGETVDLPYAARGDAGKGFAVVASEVKTLANQTSRATEEITSQIDAIQAATNDAVAAIQGIGRTILSVNEISTGIATAVEQQGAATREIAQNIQEASAGTADVSRNITGVTEAAGEAGRSSGQVLEAAGELSTQAARLRQEVDIFLANVRAA